MVETPGACRSGAKGSCQYQAMPAEARTVVLRSTKCEENVMALRHLTCVIDRDGVLLGFVFSDSSGLWRMRAFCRCRMRPAMIESLQTATTLEDMVSTVCVSLPRNDFVPLEGQAIAWSQSVTSDSLRNHSCPLNGLVLRLSRHQGLGRRGSGCSRKLLHGDGDRT